MTLEYIITDLKNYVDERSEYEDDQVQVNHLFVEKTIQDLLSKYEDYDLEAIAKEAVTLVVWNYADTATELRDIWRDSLARLIEDFEDEVYRKVQDLSNDYSDDMSWDLQSLIDRLLIVRREVPTRIERMISSPEFVQKPDVWLVNNIIEDLEDIVYNP